MYTPAILIYLAAFANTAPLPGGSNSQARKMVEYTSELRESGEPNYVKKLISSIQNLINSVNRRIPEGDMEKIKCEIVNDVPKVNETRFKYHYLAGKIHRNKTHMYSNVSSDDVGLKKYIEISFHDFDDDNPNKRIVIRLPIDSQNFSLSETAPAQKAEAKKEISVTDPAESKLYNTSFIQLLNEPYHDFYENKKNSQVKATYEKSNNASHGATEANDKTDEYNAPGNIYGNKTTTLLPSKNLVVSNEQERGPADTDTQDGLTSSSENSFSENNTTEVTDLLGIPSEHQIYTESLNNNDYFLSTEDSVFHGSNVPLIEDTATTEFSKFTHDIHKPTNFSFFPRNGSAEVPTLDPSFNLNNSSIDVIMNSMTTPYAWRNNTNNATTNVENKTIGVTKSDKKYTESDYGKLTQSSTNLTNVNLTVNDFSIFHNTTPVDLNVSSKVELPDFDKFNSSSKLISSLNNSSVMTYHSSSSPPNNVHNKTESNNNNIFLDTNPTNAQLSNTEFLPAKFNESSQTSQHLISKNDSLSTTEGSITTINSNENVSKNFDNTVKNISVSLAPENYLPIADFGANEDSTSSSMQSSKQAFSTESDDGTTTQVFDYAYDKKTEVNESASSSTIIVSDEVESEIAATSQMEADGAYTQPLLNATENTPGLVSSINDDKYVTLPSLTPTDYTTSIGDMFTTLSNATIINAKNHSSSSSSSSTTSNLFASENYFINNSFSNDSFAKLNTSLDVKATTSYSISDETGGVVTEYYTKTKEYSTEKDNLNTIQNIRGGNEFSTKIPGHTSDNNETVTTFSENFYNSEFSETSTTSNLLTTADIINSSALSGNVTKDDENSSANVGFFETTIHPSPINTNNSIQLNPADSGSGNHTTTFIFSRNSSENYEVPVTESFNSAVSSTTNESSHSTYNISVTSTETYNYQINNITAIQEGITSTNQESMNSSNVNELDVTTITTDISTVIKNISGNNKLSINDSMSNTNVTDTTPQATNVSIPYVIRKNSSESNDFLTTTSSSGIATNNTSEILNLTVSTEHYVHTEVPFRNNVSTSGIHDDISMITHEHQNTSNSDLMETTMNSDREIVSSTIETDSIVTSKTPPANNETTLKEDELPVTIHSGTIAIFPSKGEEDDSITFTEDYSLTTAPTIKNITLNNTSNTREGKALSTQVIESTSPSDELKITEISFTFMNSNNTSYQTENESTPSQFTFTEKSTSPFVSGLNESITTLDTYQQIAHSEGMTSTEPNINISGHDVSQSTISNTFQNDSMELNSIDSTKTSLNLDSLTSSTQFVSGSGNEGVDFSDTSENILIPSSLVTTTTVPNSNMNVYGKENKTTQYSNSNNSTPTTPIEDKTHRKIKSLPLHFTTVPPAMQTQSEAPNATVATKNLAIDQCKKLLEDQTTIPNQVNVVNDHRIQNENTVHETSTVHYETVTSDFNNFTFNLPTTDHITIYVPLKLSHKNPLSPEVYVKMSEINH